MSSPQALHSQTSTPHPRITSTRLSEEPSTAAALPATASLPPAATFDILAPLHELLSRLLSTDSPTVNTDPSQQSEGGNKQVLTVQQLAGETSSIRARIRHARKAVSDLPDVGRTVEEQEQEMRELREKIEGQKSVLKQLLESDRR